MRTANVIAACQFWFHSAFFSVRVNDNIGVKRVRVSVTMGGHLGELGGRSPKKFEVGGQSPNILRSTVIGCEAK